MKATRRSNQYSVCDDTVKQQTKAIYISTNTYHFNNPVTDQSREVSELTDTRAQHQLKMGGGGYKREPVRIIIWINILNSLLRWVTSVENFFSKHTFPFSRQPISDWHLNKACSILERTDVCVAVFFFRALHIWNDKTIKTSTFCISFQIIGMDV